MWLLVPLVLIARRHPAWRRSPPAEAEFPLTPEQGKAT